MTPEQIDQLILSAYPIGFQANAVTPLSPTAALGRCRYWMVEADEGTFCLRRWPKEQTNIERLQFIQAVLWHAVCEGIEIVPLPLETRQRKGIVRCQDCFWELMPWIGTIPETSSEFSQSVLFVEGTEKHDWDIFTEESFRIVSAMLALAQFHEAVVSFPLPDPPESFSVGIRRRLSCCQTWTSGRFATLRRALEEVYRLPQNDTESHLARLGLRYIDLVIPLAGTESALLHRATLLPIRVQPVIRNACFRHLRFDEDGVCGMIDFTQLGVDSVALDVATLLGSLADGNADAWAYGLKAYQSIRPLSDTERHLTAAFDVSQTLLEGLEYLDAVFLREEPFTMLQLSEILRRVEHLVARLSKGNRKRRSA